jgi:LytR cell envelope-related transcriptional attenuator
MNNGGARLVVLVVAVVVGILVLTKGFQGSAQVVGPPPTSPSPTGTSPTPSTSGSAPTTPSTGGDGGLPSPVQSGVLVAIYNATNTNGLATATADRLKAKGYVLAGQPGNLTPANTTVIYFKDDQGHADANHLRDLAIQEAKIQKLPKNLPAEASIPSKAELVIVLGSDYAQSHPVSG